ncbi:MAG: hypothetical protein KBD21_04085 [Candidatus Pacebacteria bacterium]|nr:hypothetical protein [Candidatus Paceibacterota bacterium]
MRMERRNARVVHPKEHYLPEVMRTLIRESERLELARARLENLAEVVTLDIIDGWKSGDDLLDFALVACNGVYDVMVVAMQYRHLQDTALRKPGTRILVVQEAERMDGETGGLVILRNIYLATLRPAPLEFVLNNLQIGIPVEPGYIIFRELVKEEYEATVRDLVDASWLYVGPFHNKYCEYGALRVDADGVWSAPTDAVSEVYVHPFEVSALFEEHGIGADLLQWLTNEWVRLRSRKRKTSPTNP